MPKAIIFGITGQDGSHLADLLLSKNYEVVGVSRRSSVDNKQRIKSQMNNPRLKIVEGDITDYHSIIELLQTNEEVDEVYNLAAQSHVGTSFKQPLITWDITAKGCLNILQAIVDLKLFHIRFYQASSSEMFGKNYDVDDFSEKYQDENTKFAPQSPYAVAKCAAHHSVSLFRDSYGLHASAGILFNHEGPRRGENFVTRKITKWISSFFEWKKNRYFPSLDLDKDNLICRTTGERFPKLRLGNLEAYRDWGYAGDYVEAMWLMLQQETPDDYVICTGETHTVREFLDTSFNFVGIPKWDSLVVQDPELYRPAEVDYLRGRCDKAKNKLGWSPKHNFNDLALLMVKADLNEDIYHKI